MPEGCITPESSGQTLGDALSTLLKRAYEASECEGGMSLRSVPQKAALKEAIVALGEQVETLLKERDEARANYAFMVEKVADERLEGYRDLGTRAAVAENARDHVKAQYQELLKASQRLEARNNASVDALRALVEYILILDEACTSDAKFRELVLRVVRKAANSAKG